MLSVLPFFFFTPSSLTKKKWVLSVQMHFQQDGCELILYIPGSEQLTTAE